MSRQAFNTFHIIASKELQYGSKTLAGDEAKTNFSTLELALARRLMKSGFHAAHVNYQVPEFHSLADIFFCLLFSKHKLFSRECNDEA